MKKIENCQAWPECLGLVSRTTCIAKKVTLSSIRFFYKMWMAKMMVSVFKGCTYNTWFINTHKWTKRYSQTINIISSKGRHIVINLNGNMNNLTTHMLFSTFLFFLLFSIVDFSTARNSQIWEQKNPTCYMASIIKYIAQQKSNISNMCNRIVGLLFF